MALWVKKNNNQWADVTKVWVKRSPTSWVAAKKIWVKKTSSIWSQFWPQAGPFPEEELFVSASRATYPSSGTAYPQLTATVYHFDFDGALTLRYKWSVGTTSSGPWTDLSAYETYSPGNPSSGSSNTISITPSINDYISGKVYFKFTIQASDSSGLSTYEAVSDQITMGAPLWNTQPSFSGTPATGSTLKWKVGLAYIGGVSDDVGYMTTIYRTNDNGITKQYLHGTATTPDFIFSDNYEYIFNLVSSDAGYTYHASTYAVFNDSNGDRNGNPSTLISDQKKVAAPPGAFSITSATQGKYNGSTRPVTVVWTTSANAESYEFQIDSSGDQISWINRVSYGPINIVPPTTSNTFNISSNASYIRIRMRSTNSTGLYTFTDTVIATGQAPTAPVITSATSTTTSVTLNFTAPTDNGSADNIVYGYSYKTAESSVWSDYTFATSAPNTSYTVQNLVSNTSYNFKIRATNFDKLSSPDSNIFTISTKVAPGPLTNVFAKSFDSGYITTFFTTGTNTTNVDVYYEFFETQPPRGDSQDFNVAAESSSKYFGTNTTPLIYTDELYNITLTSSNNDGISTDYGVISFILPDGVDKPTASTPTFSNITGTGFEANFSLTGSVNSVVIDVKTGGLSVSGYPKTIAVTDTTGGTSYATSTVTDLSPTTSYTFFVTPRYTDPTYTTFTYDGVQKSASVGTNYSFSMGNSLYVGTNGYVGLTSGSTVYLGPPSSGYFILAHLADFVQRQTVDGNGSGLLFYWSNSSQYSVRWNGYLRGFANLSSHRVTYQINFYKDLGYYDIKYIHIGGSVYSTDAANAAPGLYINGTIRSNGTTLPFPWLISTGQTYRVFYNGSAPTAGVAFTEIDQSNMIDAGAVTNGNSDDGFTVITTAVDKYTLPTITIGTITTTSTTLSIPLTGTFAKYDYNIRTGSHTGTSVTSGTDATSATLSITGLTAGTEYFITVTPKNTFGQTGTAQQATKSTPSLYTVTFDANSGTGAANPTSVTQTTVGGAVTLAARGTLARTKFVFGGWNTKADGTGDAYAASTSYTPASNITLYAKWNPVYTITFDSKSGSAVASIEQSTSGGSIAKPTDPTRTGYTFGGWATTDGGTTAVTWPRTPTADETLYAIWTEVVAVQYTVTWNANGGTGGTSTTQNSGVAHTPPVVTRTGFTFSRWRNPQTGGDPIFVNAGSTYTPTANITFWAQWTALPTTTATGVRLYNNFGVNITLPAGTGSVVVEWGSSTSYGNTMGTYTDAGTKSPVGPLLANTTYYFRATPWSGTSGNGTQGTAVTGSVTTYINPANTTTVPGTPIFQRFTGSNNTSYIRWGWNNNSNLIPTGDYQSWGFQFQAYNEPGLTTTYGSAVIKNFQDSTFDTRLINGNERRYVVSGEQSATGYTGEITFSGTAKYGRYRTWYLPHGSTNRVFNTVWSGSI